MKQLSLVPFAVVAFAACRDVTPPPTAPAGAKYVVSFPSLPLVAGSVAVVKAQLVDESGAIVRVARRQLRWTASAGTLVPTVCTVALPSCQQGFSLTDEDGAATINLSLSTVAGITYSVSVVDDQAMVGGSDQFTSVAGPPGLYLVIPPMDTSDYFGIVPVVPVVGSTITMMAQLADTNRNKLRIAGRTVTWSTATPGTGSFAAPTSVTDAEGIAVAKFTVGLSVNASPVVVATDDQAISGTSQPIRVAPGAPSRFVVSVDEANPPAGAPVTVFAQLSDPNGNAVSLPARAVMWSFTGPGGSLSATLGITDANGVANVVFTPTTIVGASYTVSVIDAGGSTGTTPSITTQPQVSFSSIATGFESSSVCGTSSTGDLWCWGASRFIPGRGSLNPTLTSVSLGYAFACGLTSAGAAYCWGDNSDGELGDGSQTSRGLPAPVAAAVVFRSLSAGENHACGVAVNGDAYCWGRNAEGQLGHSTVGIAATTPVKVIGGLSFVAITAGAFHTCGIVKDGSAYCWGSNGAGQLGNRGSMTPLGPVAVDGGIQFAALSAGREHTCGISQGGTGYCWGDNTYGQLGGLYGSSGAPAPVAGGLALSAIAAGGVHTCALTTGGLAYCWGDNSLGELGNGGQKSAGPVAVSGGLQFATIVASSIITTTTCDPNDTECNGPTTTSDGHSCGITTGGTAYCWGSNTYGALGVGRFPSSSPTPLRVAGQR